ncbi:PTS sugar transporter subunit IIC [Listeria welshimeri]|nr:PTS sugar transporter subunit IIC [Listeria welshimeri]MBC1622626.1 PTS sugar transporter subunit IIC [Listeria welshimeri]MBC1656104.1 PTS sugar transporter subunit IIC [Listeria welshimeri]MBC1683406.1 PTS sugar transporter subunit IIC [Listeria welshimeri]MBC1950879.1 PTS sugar transporter subunit IIC [Listeria welshimeri]
MEAINKFLPYLVKLGDNKILKSIRDGLSFTIPFTILGSVFLIIGNFPVEAWLKFITPYSSQLNSMVTVTFGVLGLISAFGVSYSLAINYGLEPLTNTVIAVLAFLLFSMNEELAIVPGNLGASGMFTAILAGILTTMVTRFVTKRNWTIKMPEGVPPAVAKSFSSLTPAAITLTIVWIIRVMLSIDITQILQSIFKPIVFSLNTIPGLIVYTLVALGLWTIGIHGPNLLSGIATPIFLTNIAVNMEAFQAGKPIPNEVAEGFWTLFMNIGGSGATIGLVIAMIFAKSKSYRELGKLSLPSAVFCINEPIIFGFPIVMNPIMAIPFVATPTILGVATIILMRLGLVGHIVLQVPWTMPPIIGPYLATNGDIGAAIWSVCTIVISYAIYFPFFKASDGKQAALEVDTEKHINVNMEAET